MNQPVENNQKPQENSPIGDLLSRQEFNRLFDDIAGNWHAIFLYLRRRAQGVASGIRFPREIDREDIISEAVVHAMQRVDRYDPKRNLAAQYFSQLMARHMLRLIDRRPRELLESQHTPRHRERQNTESLLEQKGRQLEARHFSQYVRFNSRLGTGKDASRVRQLIDRSLRRSLGAVAAAQEPMDRIRAQAAIDVLQELRKALLGRYSRVCADHARYTPSRRINRTESPATEALDADEATS
ncbi:MAG: hypothetical protein HKL96_01730 [Phycisphaerales bacterium]|nr:hypothetical protein [Phycisphaerales bacterium]